MFEKAAVIKAIKDVSIIVIAGIVIYFIVSAIEKKKCNCISEQPENLPDPNQLIVGNPPTATR